MAAYNKHVFLSFSILVVEVLCLSGIQLVDSSKVTSITPRQGSLAGATRITISGQGFSEDPFNYGTGNEANGNQVFLKNQFTTYVCSVIPYYCNEEKIVCDTRSIGKEGSFDVFVIVDGDPVTDYCTKKTDCKFQFKKSNTPTIQKITPSSGIAGTKLSTRGKIITDIYDPSQNLDPEGSDGRNQILRVYWGNYACDPFDAASGELYNIALDRPGSSHGVIECVPKGTFIASQTVSYLVSNNYGRSWSERDALLVSGQSKLYHFQAHADVLGVHPDVGSTEGGTTLNITGQFFDERDTKVLVGGIPCEISSMTTTQILCVTGQAPTTRAVYPGERGLLYEVWTDTAESLDDAVWDTTAPDYNFTLVPDASSPIEHRLGEEDNFISRLSGFFVPPRSGSYQFKIRSDDDSRLYLSLSSDDPSNKTLIAYLDSVSSSWDSYPSQASEIFNLIGNQSYYMEALCRELSGLDFIEVGVVLFDVPLSNDDVSAAQNEVQQIETLSVVIKEMQTLTIEGATYEVQEISIVQSSCPEGNCAYKLQLGENDTLTGDISVTATAAEMESSLNLLLSPDTVSVTMETSSIKTVYAVEFRVIREDIPLLRVVGDDPDLVITVSQRTAFTPIELNSFHIVSDGVTSATLSSSSSAEEVQSALLDMFSVKCTSVGLVSGYYVQDFEGDMLGYVDGNVVQDEEPFCGRSLLKDPQHIFYAGKTLKPGTAMTVKAFDVRYNGQLCVAYRGALLSKLQMYYHWVDNSNNDRFDWQTFNDVPFEFGSEDWRFSCIDIGTLSTTQGWIYQHHKKGYPLLIGRIKLAGEEGQDYFVDNLYIGSQTPQYIRDQRPARPNGIFVSDVNVRQRGYSYDITFTSAKCGFNYPLLGIKNADLMINETDRAVYVNATAWPAGVNISIMRESRATPPISGTFDLSLFGSVIQVPSQATADKLKELFQSNLDIGALNVGRQGTCAGYIWKVEWASKGGSQPLMEVNGDRLIGNEVDILSERLRKGQLFMAPIPGEFLRMPHEGPQVEVIVNTIPSSCSGGLCSFDFSLDATPEISAVSPASGSVNTTLTLSGTGFSTVPEDNIVTIGGIRCDITASSDTSMTALVGEVPAGFYNITLTVNGKGLARYPSGVITFQSELEVSSIDPESGSTAGGTTVTISGHGFSKNGENTTVYVGTQACLIESVTYGKIQCVIALKSGPQTFRRYRRAVTTVNVSINVNGESKVLDDSYNYDAAQTPSITEINPTTSNVKGGGDLVISGSGFGDSGAVVSIGNAKCLVKNQSDDEITAVIPEHTPGNFPVELTVTDKGFAEFDNNNFKYELEVTGMFPDRGSFQGGTVVTLTGAGFGSNASDVTVGLGDINCEVTAVDNDTIDCVAASSEKEHRVDNFGKHESLGLGYKWNPSLLNIVAGDVVVWQWAVPQYVTGIGYAVMQTDDADSVSYDGQGFISGGRTTEGIFAYKFASPGTYYYSSGPVDDDEQVYMKGTIVVKEPTSSAHKLVVEVAGFEALHDTMSGVSAPVSSDPCPGSDSPIPGCNDPKAQGEDPAHFFFSFWICSTPVVQQISPNEGDATTLIRIQGIGFSEDPCENKISVGDYNCITKNSTNTALTCLIDTAVSMKVGERHQVSVTVKNRGLALTQITSPEKQVFVLKPQIDGLSTHEGSLSGGTEILISGDGFSADSPDDIEVRIGETGCRVQTVSYKEVVCITTTAEAGNVQLTIQINSQQAVCKEDCSFMFSAAMTPQVNGVSPADVSGPSTLVIITGSGFDNDATVVTVSIGGVGCVISSVTSGEIQCGVSYVPVGTQQITVNIAGKGNAHFNVSSTVTSSNTIENISPSVGSTAGGQMLTIVGNGFIGGATQVEINGQNCEVESVTLSEIRCKTGSHTEGTVDLIVTSNSVVYPTESYQYSAAATPVVTTVTPTEGKSGDQITIDGSSFSTDPSDVTVTIDGTQCAIASVTMDTVVCSVGTHSAGRYGVVVHIKEKGLSADDTQFEYELAVTGVTPSEGSFGGGRTMNVSGSGFDGTALVTLCGNVCPIISFDSSTIQCDVPSNSGSGDQVCDVIIALASGATVAEPDSFTYRASLTPVIDSIEPHRGGTAGGTTLTITGSGFQVTGNRVTIGGAECSIVEELESKIVCMTAAHRPSEMTKVRVEVGSNGIATQDNADFYYIDVWSSQYTWGYEDPPIEGDFVTIPAGQTLLLDVSTPILKMLLIQGGTLMFDEADIELHAENILVVDGGVLQVGTEEEPFQHQATIMMHGHVRSQELPLFGAKTLAVRNGTLDLHGMPIPMTWTRLAETAAEGATEMNLEQAVTWKVGDQVVIATTSHRHSQYENEELTITDVSADGSKLTFSPPLKYEHVGITQTIEGVTLDMRAEVGLLTRNVKVRGSVQEEWIEEYDACPEEFDTDQFAAQTCFLGKFGEETGSDQFGSQIMLFPKYKGQQLVKGRIEHVEVTHAGQAFRLGRYPIHFHLCGDMSGSYVRGCGIHNTFNRALTMHGTHNLLVEHNVAYKVMGHAYFLEDGIETGNIIQYNLGVFIRPSSSLLNVDITPATYWVTNPDNIIRHNAAAGGSHFGFWYNMPSHPEGPSATRSICPRSVPLGEFHNNTAHAMGWYGLWVFPTYHPKVGGACGAREDEPAKFHSLFAWETERGAEAVNVGAVQFHDFVISDTDKAGVEYQLVTAPWGAEGALVKNLVVIAYSEISEDAKELECTIEGIKGPQNDGLTIDGAKLINFDQDRCAGIGYCSKCRLNQGGFSVRFQNLEFLNSPNKAAFQWEHECWLEDLDGTLTGTTNGIVLPTNPNLPLDHCFQDASYSVGVVPGSFCDDTVRLHRLAFNKPSPPSLLYKDALFANAYGTSRVPYRHMRLTHPKGWMVTLIDSDNYNFIFEDVDHVTNISYNARFYEFKEGDFLLMNHNFTQTPDRFAINGEIKNSSEQTLTYDSSDNEDLHFENETRTLTYIVSGKGEASSVDRDVSLNVYSCFYQDCIKPVPKPPPEGRPEEFRIWSDPESWEHSAVPVDGEDVMILPTVWMVADVPLPVMNKLFVYGTLEIEDTRDNKLEATYILIQGGRLIIGFSESNPFEHDFKILLNGNHLTPDQPLPNGPNLGSKALGVFGGLDLHGKSHSVYWTQLSATVSPGENTLTVVAVTDWVVGDEIVVATTSYEAWQTETFTIVEVKDPSTFQINGTFAFKHTALVTADYILAAEVGLLTRNIKIEGSDYDRLFDESFGARVLVGMMIADGTEYKGYARISNVQFFHTGQEGYTAPYDPRYSLAYLDVGEVTDLNPSYVKGCSFHNGFSPAIGVYGSTEGLLVQDNVVHHTVGPGVIVQGEYNQLVHNLITLVIFPGTYQDRAELENLMWNAGIEVESAGKLVLINNTVAGSERVAFKIKGETCFEAPNPLTDWYGNVGHSTLHGIHMHLISQNGCSKIANFLIYKSWDFGIYHQVESSIIMTGMTFVDNKVAVLSLVYGPNALSHKTSDKFVRLEKSLLVGVSEAFDCVADDVEPENAWQSSGQRGFRYPGKGHVGVTWATFGSGPNLAPLFAFHRGDSYPAINGITELRNVVFRSFGSHCGKTDVAIMTNPASEDTQHPMVTSGIRLEDVDAVRRIFITRPRVSSVNPSDCVDMDCDGLKKAMIRDLDGTLLGSVGTVIPQSEYEWDGDPRRGLGDYRIPKSLLTKPDGTQIPVEDKAPNKGVYRGKNNECVWKADWQAYECHGIDHMMLVVESMDADTEVRRLSPLAMYSDSYVDLINGPKDNGWCNGYTCQERISTFNALIATGKEYEVYFTSTNPQTLRFHLLNSQEDQAVLLGIFYTKPERLDVYYEDLYVTPNNADFSEGELIWKPKDPNLPTDQYKPSLTSMVHGENYFDRDTQTLWVLIRGSVPIDIRTVPVIELSLGVPGVAIDDFYEQENLIANLADLLNVDPSQIRVVNVVSEANGRRRRRTAEGEAEIILEMGPQPALSIESPGSDGATTEAPRTTPSSEAGVSLDYEALVAAQSILADARQLGFLSKSLNISIISMTMTEPSPTVVDPTGGERATNETGGSDDVPEGTKTYDEIMREEEQKMNAENPSEVVYLTPSHLVIHTQPGEAVEAAPFSQQPALYAVDTSGNIIPQMGHRLNPWQLTATINPSTPGVDIAGLTGNQTIDFDGSWANFTDLAVSISTSGILLDFRITHPNTSNLPIVTSEAFDVAERPYYLAPVNSPDIVYEMERFEVMVELRDEINHEVPYNLTRQGYDWEAKVAISMPSNYKGQLRGQTEATFNLDTAQARFSNLSIDATGVKYILRVSVTTIPASHYQLSLLLAPFDVETCLPGNYTGPTRKVVLRFLSDYDQVAAGKEVLLAINFQNHIDPKYPAVKMSNVVISRGSILISFDMQGDVDLTQEVMWSDIQGGRFSLEFDGYTLIADEYMKVDDVEYGPKEVGHAGFPHWAIALIVIFILAMMCGVGIVVYKIHSTRGKQISYTTDELLGEEQAFNLRDFSRSATPSGMEGGISDKLPFLIAAPTNSPRRTPEITVRSLPPGFTEATGQVEQMRDDRVNMLVRVKNQDGSLQKITIVQGNKVGTIRALRKDVKQALPAKLLDKKFILLDEGLKDISGAKEKELTVSEIYHSECVMIRWLQDSDVNKLCVCGLMGQFECSLCHHQAYCSPQCQASDWIRHTRQCTNDSTV